jgi:hypothetical protein
MPVLEEDSLQLYLNSKYAAQKPNNGDTGFCIFEYPVITLPDGKYIYLSLVSATIPYSFYSINSNNNGLHIVDNSGGTYTFNVTPGNYNIYQLRSAILAELGGGWDLLYNAVTNKVTFDLSLSVSSGFTIYSDGTLNHALGFSDTTNTVSVGGLATSTQGINLNQIRAINVEIDMPSPSINVAQPFNQNILATIPVAVQPYGMINWTNSNNFRINMMCEQMNMIKVKFIDNQGNLINMNNVNWQATLQLDAVNFTD